MMPLTMAKEGDTVTIGYDGNNFTFTPMSVHAA